MILNCGEALIDMLPCTSREGVACFAPHAGGSVFNTAIALGRLGGPSGFFSGISNDMFGEMLAQALAASNVDSSFAARSNRPTTLAFVRLVDGQATYSFNDENTAGRMLGADDIPDLPDHVGAMFFGGISLMVTPCAATYEAMLSRYAPTRVTMIDPNIRPDFITDDAAYRARIDRMLAKADLVKLSDEDLRWLLGDGDPRVLAGEVLRRGPVAVFVTEGARGAFARTSETTAEMAANPVVVADTVGAGDTFNAGVLAALADREKLTKRGIAALTSDDLTAALALGVGSAAVTVSRAGADPPWRRELDI
ncbi:MAG: carbohydrate kinase [Pseudomonadota bacterium]